MEHTATKEGRTTCIERNDDVTRKIVVQHTDNSIRIPIRVCYKNIDDTQLDITATIGCVFRCVRNTHIQFRNRFRP